MPINRIFLHQMARFFVPVFFNILMLTNSHLEERIENMIMILSNFG
jgi:hypothetical protein